MDWLWISIYHATAMLWEVLWALVFGFTIPGVLQVFVSKEEIAKRFGKVNLRSIVMATGLGAASSSCSYAAVAAARSALQNWSMLWKEMAIGFLIAGFLGTLVPAFWWKAVFLNGGPPILQSVENAIVGPLIAVASFVCSIGNIPLASVLWSGGISFGGVISFIYADLIVIPLILIYRKYYGARATSSLSR